MNAGDPLRSAVEAVCDQFCRVAAGDLSERLTVDTDDSTAQKLALLGNGVLEVARRAIATAQAKEREREAAARIARLGSWKIDLFAGATRVEWSADLHKLLGTDERSFRPSMDALQNLVHPADRERARLALGRALKGRPDAFDWRAVCPDGRDRHLWTKLQPRLEDGRVVSIDAVCQDVSERRAAEVRMRHLAERDGLTGLFNRGTFRERLDTALKRRTRRRGDARQVGVLYIDLDGFKAVNDRYGHAAGDALLAEAAERMRQVVRGSDAIARLGGDEFALMLSAPALADAAARLATRLVEVLAEPYRLGEGLVARGISASIGIALHPTDGADGDALLGAADAAMYSGKANGRGQVRFFEPCLQRDLAERRRLDGDVREALRRGELFLAYQPLVNVADARTIGFEALLRWRHPDLGLVPPDRFVPLAEASGAIVEIGEWTLRQAALEAASWTRPLTVAVNVSPVQLQQGPGFVRSLSGALRDAGLDPARLEIEVTEGVLIRDPQSALDALQAVRRLGVRVALDDFGTGYSSLATLRSFPFDKIKIDRRFVSGLGEGSSEDAAIVRAVLGLARGLSLPVVAEGVETRHQHEALRIAHCQIAQGWLFGKPGPVPADLRGAMSVPGD